MATGAKGALAVIEAKKPHSGSLASSSRIMLPFSISKNSQIAQNELLRKGPCDLRKRSHSPSTREVFLQLSGNKLSAMSLNFRTSWKTGKGDPHCLIPHPGLGPHSSRPLLCGHARLASFVSLG